MALKLGDAIPADCDDVGPLLLRSFKDDGTGHLAKNDDVTDAPPLQGGHLLRLDDPYLSNLYYEALASENLLQVCEDRRVFGEANKLLRLRLEAVPPPPITITVRWTLDLPAEDGSQGIHTGGFTEYTIPAGVPWSVVTSIPDASYLGYTVHGWSGTVEYDPTQSGPQFRCTATDVPNEVSGGGQERIAVDSGWQDPGVFLRAAGGTFYDDSQREMRDAANISMLYDARIVAD